MSKKRRTTKARPARAPRLDKWEVQNAADTVMRNAEIEANSRLKKAADAELVKRRTAITKAIRRKPKKT